MHEGALGIFFIKISCGILAVAFGCAFLLFMSDAQLEPTLFGRTRVQVCCFPLEGPPKSGKRTFIALDIRVHIETLCCCRTCFSCIPGLGLQRCHHSLSHDDTRSLCLDM